MVLNEHTLLKNLFDQCEQITEQYGDGILPNNVLKAVVALRTLCTNEIEKTKYDNGI